MNDTFPLDGYGATEAAYEQALAGVPLNTSDEYGHTSARAVYLWVSERLAEGKTIKEVCGDVGTILIAELKGCVE